MMTLRMICFLFSVKRKSDIEPVEVAVGKKQKVEDTETESSTESATA